MSRRRNIVLVGFMGTGKSRVGRQLAAQLGWSFVDMDDLIVQRQGKSVPRIFAEDGEPAFRKLERDLAIELSGRDGLVIATGGGIVLNPDNIRDFSRAGLVVRLDATPEAILARVGNDTNRPLLAGGDKMRKIVELMEKRRSLYDAIPCQVDTTGLTPDAVTERILAEYRATP